MPFDYTDAEIQFFDNSIEKDKQYECKISNIEIAKGEYGEYIKLTITTPIKKNDVNTICTRIFSLINDKVPRVLRELFKTHNISERNELSRVIGQNIIIQFYPQMNMTTKEYKKDEDGNVYAGFDIKKIITQSQFETKSIDGETIICNLCKRAIKKDKFKDHVISNCQLGF